MQVWKSDERINQFLNIVGRHLLKYLFMKRQFSRAILSITFRMLSSVNKGNTWALWFRKYIIRKDFFCETNNLLIEFKCCAQTSEECYKWGSNILWYIDFRVFLSIKYLNLDKIPFALFNSIAISEVCCFQLRYSSIFIPRYFTEFVE